METSDLKIFATVARLGGMNRAAIALNTVQSNVTARVRALEHKVGCALFERQPRGVVLTTAGQRLLPYAEQILTLLEAAHRAARDDGEPQGTLLLGSLETTAALRLAPVLSRFVAAFPRVDLVLRTGTTAELVEAVLKRRLEGAFVCGPVEHGELEVAPVFSEELVLLAAPAVASLAAAIDADTRMVVLKAGCSYRQRLESVLARRGLQTPRLLEFGTIEAIFKCVGAGLGITLLPRSLVVRIRPKAEVSMHRLPRAEARVETLFVRRRDGVQSRALLAFLKCAAARGPQAQRRSA
ncbi:MAG TPA: LysR substrate-binding domain-containing protein [Hyphomicrobiaceae bacterium]|nr:LysR substrate-binding domain-containing protein [Hyphomicrobiaceae bacterium]